jgi:hypothetical protein
MKHKHTLWQILAEKLPAHLASFFLTSPAIAGGRAGVQKKSLSVFIPYAKSTKLCLNCQWSEMC